MDSQSVKGSVHQGNGYDGAKRVNGHKRHELVDSLGLLLEVVVTAADVADRQGLRCYWPEHVINCRVFISYGLTEAIVV